ncbi:MAG: epoxyqueuosine reductase QueH [Treponemataceae bacterium]
MQLLDEVFDSSIFFFNPNIYPEQEYKRRFNELQSFLHKAQYKHAIISQPYDYNSFLSKTAEKKMCAEGGERCFICYDLRMSQTAEYAKKHNFDFFTTSLSISPHKNAQKINEIGDSLEKKLGVNYLYADFKKENGFKISTDISKEFNLYRQQYCGCEFSMRREENST